MDSDIERAYVTAGAVANLGDRQVIVVRRLLELYRQACVAPQVYLAVEAHLDQLLVALREIQSSSKRQLPARR